MNVCMETVSLHPGAFPQRWLGCASSYLEFGGGENDGQIPRM